MTAPTLTHLVSAQTIATATSLSSGSVTITAGRPAMAIVFSGALNSDDNTTPPSFSGAGQTWTQLLTTTDVFADTGYNDYMRVSLFVTDASSGGSGALTATHPPGEQQDILAFAVFDLTDGSFASPEPLAKGNNATSMTDALAGVAAGDRYAALCLWTSFYTSSPGGFTARSGWTEVTQVIAADAGYGLALQVQLSPVGGDATASFSVSNTGQLALIAIPLEAATAGETTWSAAAHIVSGSACAGSQRMIRRRRAAPTAASVPTTMRRVIRARTVTAAAGSSVLGRPRLLQARGVSVQGAASLSTTAPIVSRRYTAAVTGGATLAIVARTVRTRSVSVVAQAVLATNASVAGYRTRSAACTAQSSVGLFARMIRSRAVSAGGFSTVSASAHVAGKLTRGAAVSAASSIALSAQVSRRRSAAIGTQTAVLASGNVSGKLIARSAPTAAAMVTVQLRVIRNRRSAAGASGTANADPRIRRPRRAGVTAASALVLTRRVILARAANVDSAPLVAVRFWISGLSTRRHALPRASANGGVVAPSERRGRVQPHLRGEILR
ncbi:hypothetical protein [Pontitalea aquivivens]|uniref:hypothetical protein n=1 Tax=Pontitalea aquivivens TaxID=3388663 RepID=UPI003970A8E9